MKPHHAAALALVVWYMIVPPERCADRTRNDIDTCSQVLDLNAPLPAWFRTWPSYNTEAECEHVLNMERHWSPASGPPGLNFDQRLVERELAAERCVSSGVLKLNPKDQPPGAAVDL